MHICKFYFIFKE